jgi:hypothetical protein
LKAALFPDVPLSSTMPNLRGADWYRKVALWQGFPETPSDLRADDVRHESNPNRRPRRIRPRRSRQAIPKPLSDGIARNRVS